MQRRIGLLNHHIVRPTHNSAVLGKQKYFARGNFLLIQFSLTILSP
jgi:hypothetical protein